MKKLILIASLLLITACTRNIYQTNPEQGYIQYFSSFTKENKKKLLKSYSKGRSDTAAILILDISKETFNEWLQDESKRNFTNFINKGRLLSQKYWENKLEKAVEDEDINQEPLMFLLKKRFEQYQEPKKETIINNIPFRNHQPLEESYIDSISTNNDDV